MNFFWVKVTVKVNSTQSFQLQLLLSYWKYHCPQSSSQIDATAEIELIIIIIIIETLTDSTIYVVYCTIR